MRRPFRQLVVADPQTLLPPSAPSRTHRHLFFSRMHSHSTRHTDEHKLLQVTKQISRLAPRAANRSTKDCTELIERQIARFAPGFRDCILARSISSPVALERWNPNLVGGDFLGGSMDFRQLLFRPTPSLYRTPRSNLYLCGASTPPGGGVHGMCGYQCATTALTYLGGNRPLTKLVVPHRVA